MVSALWLSFLLSLCFAFASAPQIRSSTLENHPLPEFKKRQASLTLVNKKFMLSQFVDENRSPIELQKPSPKRNAISQIFNHFKSVSKKDKSRRQTIVIPEAPEIGENQAFAFILFCFALCSFHSVGIKYLCLIDILQDKNLGL